MRRVGLKRACPEPSYDHNQPSPLAPHPKRARLSVSPARGVLKAIYDGVSYLIGALWARLPFASTGMTEESESEESFSLAYTQDDPQSAPDQEISGHDDDHETQGHSVSVSTVSPVVSHPPVSRASHGSLRTHSGSRAAHNPFEVYSLRNPRSLPRALASPPLVSVYRNRAAPTSSTPVSSSKHPYRQAVETEPTRTGSVDRRTAKAGTSYTSHMPTPSFAGLDTLRVTHKLPVDVGRTPENIGPESAELRSGLAPAHSVQLCSPRSRPSVSQVHELREWIQDLRALQKGANEERQVQLELAESKLRVQRAERRAMEDERVCRLRSLFSSTSLEEPKSLCFDLSDEQVKKVARATRGGPATECLSTAYNISITRGDLRTLVGLNWLNDNVINFYFNLIRDSHPAVHVMSTFFYPKLSQSGYTSVRRWTKKVDLFVMDLVLFPIHLGAHWCLAAADFQTSTLSYYDSLLGENSACLPRLRRYLEEESFNKKGERFSLNSWKEHICKEIPRQENGSDCGVFMCMYARHLAEKRPFKFGQADAQQIRELMICEILEQKLLG